MQREGEPPGPSEVGDAVSHGIRPLEACLSHALFVRERPALSLTTQGQRLFASVSGGFAAIAEMLNEMVDLPKRDILVLSTSTVMATEWLTPRLPAFRKAHPNLMVDLRTLDRDIDLTANNIDVHLRIGDGNWPGCEAKPLWPEVIMPVCSPAYKSQVGDIPTPDHLLKHRLIDYNEQRLHSQLGWMTPCTYTAAITSTAGRTAPQQKGSVAGESLQLFSTDGTMMVWR